jgi:hypothetical protein
VNNNIITFHPKERATIKTTFVETAIKGVSVEIHREL